MSRFKKGINPDAIFSRNIPGSYDILKNKCVGIAGAGGLGSNVAVLLARSGIGKLVVADFDRVAPENLNRQHFFIDQIGKLKVEALESTILNINPYITFIQKPVLLNKENIPRIFEDVDALVEAFDDAQQKTMLIESWMSLNNGKLLVSASGLAGFGKSDEIKINRVSENLVIVGDQRSKLTEGLIAPRVMIAAAIQANLVVEYLLLTK
jgi:sulfur carrier protein ThiS adenylyltransferase